MSNNSANGSIIESLCDGGIITVDSDTLANIKQYRRKGVKGLVIFEPPKPGTDILLLEHFVSDRRPGANTSFCMEEGFDREWVIYHVEKHIIMEKQDNYYYHDNKVVLSYKILHGPVRERTVKFGDFFCGFYYAKVLNDEEVEIAKKFRRIVNESFNIRRF